MVEAMMCSTPVPCPISLRTHPELHMHTLLPPYAHTPLSPCAHTAIVMDCSRPRVTLGQERSRRE
eukprot:623810-Rhodomonas_salina.1